MRNVMNLNENWQFVRRDAGVDGDRSDAVPLSLPHTWNGIDGQDGGNDYHRGTCWYYRNLDMPIMQANDRVYLEFAGVAMEAQIYVNGQMCGGHKGGFSTFRVDITDVLQQENCVAVRVDNSYTPEIYPQKADFTFYGGIYRDVKLIVVPQVHFALNCHGGTGLKVTPEVQGASALVTIEAWVSGPAEGTLALLSVDGVGSVSTPVHDGYARGEIAIKTPHLWDGVADPYLYTARARCAGDEVSARFGCRTFAVDPDRGFLLNGRPCPLRGVSRHQDREGVGNAVTADMHREDFALIREMGANTVRLAHYQHDQVVYDLCDELGLVVWAEIPYITSHMPEGWENTISQMTELIVQNYNHPSIFCWGLSNEITAHGEATDDLVANHKALNALCHELDSTRPTTMAHVFMLDIGEPLVSLPDICSYNLYYGWYLGELEDNDKWFDAFRQKYPDKAIGLSEYGADANPQYQTAAPKRGDYSEQYQAIYHEHMLRMLSARPYIWASHVWNMFDFAADGRDEGGKHGVNQKGLVSFDRKIKKDAFYLYKAYLSDTPFVHLCSRRYVDRPEEITQIKVYTNQPQVSLYMDGQLVETKQGDKVVCFQVPISAEHRIEAVSGKCRDQIHIRKAAEPNPEYRMEVADIINWFDKDELAFPAGYYSIQDKLGEIKSTPEGAGLVEQFMAAASASRGEVAQGVKRSAEMENMLNNMTVEGLIRQAGKGMDPSTVLSLNRALNRIPKEN